MEKRGKGTISQKLYGVCCGPVFFQLSKVLFMSRVLASEFLQKEKKYFETTEQVHRTELILVLQL